MGKWIGKVAIGLMLATGGATALPAQSSAVSNPARKFMTPDQARRGTNSKFYQEFDNRQLVDPLYTSDIHGQAGLFLKLLASRDVRKTNTPANIVPGPSPEGGSQTFRVDLSDPETIETAMMAAG